MPWNEPAGLLSRPTHGTRPAFCRRPAARRATIFGHVQNRDPSAHDAWGPHRAGLGGNRAQSGQRNQGISRGLRPKTELKLERNAQNKALSSRNGACVVSGKAKGVSICNGPGLYFGTADLSIANES